MVDCHATSSVLRWGKPGVAGAQRSLQLPPRTAHPALGAEPSRRSSQTEWSSPISWAAHSQLTCPHVFPRQAAVSLCGHSPARLHHLSAALPSA